MLTLPTNFNTLCSQLLKPVISDFKTVAKAYTLKYRQT